MGQTHARYRFGRRGGSTIDLDLDIAAGRGLEAAVDRPTQIGVSQQRRLSGLCPRQTRHPGLDHCACAKKRA
jgi:hypothetical protein